MRIDSRFVETPPRKSAVPQLDGGASSASTTPNSQANGTTRTPSFQTCSIRDFSVVERERVAVDDHDVGALAGFERAELVLQTHQLGGARGGRVRAPARA